MNIVKNEKGITLIALVITIIILLILVGLTLIIGNNLIIDKAVLANNKTIEVILKENIELAWLDAQAAYIENARRNEEVNKSDYMKSVFVENLQKLDGVSEINVTDKSDGNMAVDFQYKNQEYSFLLTVEGKAEQILLLKGNVKVGDYIEYPIEYYDVYTGEYCTTQNGWMVLDDGVMSGTSGVVRITSTNIPAKWYYDLALYENNIAAENALLNDFENLELVHNTLSAQSEEVEVNQSLKGSYFKVSPIAKKVTAMTVSDLNSAYNAFYSVNRASDDVSPFNDEKDLFHIRDPGVYHWLATRNKDSDKKMYYLSFSGVKDEADLRLGIRPVIYLDEEQIGILNSNIWKMIY